MPLTEILSEDQKRRRVWKRIQYLAAFLFLMVVALVIAREYQSGYMTSHQNWIQNYGEKLFNNYEPILVAHLQENNVEKINLLLDTLREQPVVIETVLFDASGNQLSSQPVVPSTQLLVHYASGAPQLFIRELIADNVHLGYLRMTLDREFLLKQNHPISQSNPQLLGILSALSLILGFLLGIRFARWRLYQVH